MWATFSVFLANHMASFFPTGGSAALIEKQQAAELLRRSVRVPMRDAGPGGAGCLRRANRARGGRSPWGTRRAWSRHRCDVCPDRARATSAAHPRCTSCLVVPIRLAGLTGGGDAEGPHRKPRCLAIVRAVMRRGLVSLLAAVVAVLLPAVAQADSSDQIVRFSTSLGNIDVQLLPQSAPKTVANFLGYVTSG